MEQYKRAPFKKRVAQWFWREYVPVAYAPMRCYFNDVFRYDREIISGYPIGSIMFLAVGDCGTHLYEFDKVSGEDGFANQLLNGYYSNRKCYLFEIGKKLRRVDAYTIRDIQRMAKDMEEAQ